jgi:hypothetical protein
MPALRPLRVNADFYEELPGFDAFPRRDFGSMVYRRSITGVRCEGGKPRGTGRGPARRRAAWLVRWPLLPGLC